jgi:hypothetical protein
MSCDPKRAAFRHAQNLCNARPLLKAAHKYGGCLAHDPPLDAQKWVGEF